MEKISKLDLYRVKPISLIGKFFAKLPHKRKQKFFASEPFLDVKVISFKRMYILSTSENVENYGKEILRIRKTLRRIFLQLEYETAHKQGVRPEIVIENFKQEKYFTIEGDSIVFTDFALSLIE